MGSSMSCLKDRAREHPPYSWPKDHPKREAAIRDIKARKKAGLPPRPLWEYGEGFEGVSGVAEKGQDAATEGLGPEKDVLLDGKHAAGAVGVKGAVEVPEDTGVNDEAAAVVVEDETGVVVEAEAVAAAVDSGERADAAVAEETQAVVSAEAVAAEEEPADAAVAEEAQALASTEAAADEEAIEKAAMTEAAAAAEAAAEEEARTDAAASLAQARAAVAGSSADSDVVAVGTKDGEDAPRGRFGDGVLEERAAFEGGAGDGNGVSWRDDAAADIVHVTDPVTGERVTHAEFKARVKARGLVRERVEGFEEIGDKELEERAEVAAQHRARAKAKEAAKKSLISSSPRPVQTLASPAVAHDPASSAPEVPEAGATSTELVVEEEAVAVDDSNDVLRRDGNDVLSSSYEDASEGATASSLSPMPVA